MRRAHLLVLGAFAAACAVPTDSGLDRPALGKASTGPTVTATDPTSAPQDTTLDIRVLGSGYDQGARVDLALGGVTDPTRVHTNSTRFVSSKELVANVTIARDAVEGSYDVLVATTSGKKGIGTELFLVRAVTDIGTLGGATAQASGVNSSGIVAGSADDAGGYRRGYVWSEATGMIALPGEVTLTNGVDVAGLNDAGVVIGTMQNHAHRWVPDGTSGWAAQDLGTLGGDFSWPFAINASGVIVGQTFTAAGAGRAFRWSETEGMVELPQLPGGTGGRAHGINDAGIVVGEDGVGQEVRPVVWLPAGGGLALPLCSGAVGGQAMAINAGGVIVGDCSYRKRGGQLYMAAVRWLPASSQLTAWLAPQQLTSPTACPVCDRAQAVNDAGEIVGVSSRRPFLWDEAHGLRYLGTFMLNGTGLGLAINDPQPGAEFRIVGMAGKGGASGGNRAVWWRKP